MLLDLLLHGTLLQLSRQRDAEGISNGIQTAGSLVGIERNELGEHKVAQRADIVLVAQSSKDAVVEGENRKAREGGFEKGIEGFVRGLKANGKHVSNKRDEWKTYLPNFKTIVNLVLERTHGNFSDQLGVDDGLLQNIRNQGSKIGDDQISLVVCG